MMPSPFTRSPEPVSQALSMTNPVWDRGRLYISSSYKRKSWWLAFWEGAKAIKERSPFCPFTTACVARWMILSFETLKDHSGKYLIEQYALQYQYSTALLKKQEEDLSSDQCLAMA